MFNNAESELLEFKKRLAIMEQAELDRRTKDLTEKEELALNGGKKGTYFQAPMMSTKRRKLDRELSATL